MNKFVYKYKLTTGQVIPLVALIMFALIAMAALVLDGGTLLSFRRTAQAAADAGAMAGAQHQCYDLSADPGGVAVTYATNNGATTATANVGDYLVTVNTTVAGESYFAKIFGIDQLQAKAEATAGCLGVRGKGVIPLAWRCWPNDDPTNTAFIEDYSCQVQPVDWNIIGPFVKGAVETVTLDGVFERHTDDTSLVDNKDAETPKPPGQIYIFFQSEKLCVEEFYEKCTYADIDSDGDLEITSCTQSDNTVVYPPYLEGDYQCDLTGDGKLDIQLGGNRGTLYLTSENQPPIKWITSDTQPDITLKPHVWLTADPGVGAVVNQMDKVGWSGEIVLIPIYNEICEPKSPTDTPSCIEAAHANPPWPEFDGVDRFDMKPGGNLWFHIIAFQPFYISCVSSSGDCPGYRYAQTLNPDLGDNVDVVEGFFLSYYDDTSLDAQNFCDFDLGNCQISLTEKPEN